MEIKFNYDTHFSNLIEEITKEYGHEILTMDGEGDQLDISNFSKGFFKVKTTADVSVDANANVDDLSVISYMKESTKAIHRLNSLYMIWRTLREEYGYREADEVVKLQILGDIYIGDLHGASVMPYCYNYSTYDIVVNGLTPVKKVKSLPPKHLYAFKSQVEQFVVIASNSTLGATGLADLFISMSYYVKKIVDTLEDDHFKFASEEDVWKYVKANIVSLVYTINQPMRGEQSAFTNVSIYDKFFLEELCPGYIFPDGSTPDISIVQAIQGIFLDVMNEELERTVLTFPVTTACFAIDENKEIKDEDFLDYIAGQNTKWGFINIYEGDSSTMSSCCRLRSEGKGKNEYFNAFGSGSTKIGSLGVVTINLPRIAFISKTKQEYISRLRKLVGLCAKINDCRRKLIQKKIDNGNHPLYTLGFIDIKTQYSTVGVNGLNEALEILGYDILTPLGQDVALEIINTINDVNDKMQEKYNFPHNVEQVPGENISIKLAKKDRYLGYNDRYSIYSNQFIPLTTRADLMDRIRLQGIFDSKFSGGSICHLNLDTRVDKETQKELIRTCAKKGVIYMAINFNLQECENGHISVSKGEECSICGAKIESNYTRVVGFITCTKNWAKERREEDYPNREFYSGIEL